MVVHDGEKIAISGSEFCFKGQIKFKGEDSLSDIKIPQSKLSREG
jgi:hypothetical protein